MEINFFEMNMRFACALNSIEKAIGMRRNIGEVIHFLRPITHNNFKMEMYILSNASEACEDSLNNIALDRDIEAGFFARGKSVVYIFKSCVILKN